MYPKLIGKRNEKGITQEEMGKLLGISKNNYNLKENVTQNSYENISTEKEE